MAKGNQVLINEMEHFTVQGSGNNTSPGGRDYPGKLIFTWQNGTDTVRILLAWQSHIALLRQLHYGYQFHHNKKPRIYAAHR
jgi:hypothetical protein